MSGDGGLRVSNRNVAKFVHSFGDGVKRLFDDMARRRRCAFCLAQIVSKFVKGGEETRREWSYLVLARLNVNAD